MRRGRTSTATCLGSGVATRHAARGNSTSVKADGVPACASTSVVTGVGVAPRRGTALCRGRRSAGQPSVEEGGGGPRRYESVKVQLTIGPFVVCRLARAFPTSWQRGALHSASGWSPSRTPLTPEPPGRHRQMVVAGKRRVHYTYGVAAGVRGWGPKKGPCTVHGGVVGLCHSSFAFG